VKPIELQKGDQLNTLEDRFQKLTEEILVARDLIKKEAEEKLMLEKRNMEMKQKEKELLFLQSITQAIGIGVMTETPEGKEAANQQMEVFAWLCGGLSKFDIENAENEEITLFDRNGERRIFNISSPAIFNDEKICLVRDITEIREETDALEHMAMHDALTGLPNRALLQDRLQQAIFVGQREEKELALLMMDLDRFKEINDTLGHHIGDLILKEVGKRLPGVLRKSDTFARLGGDEFAVVLPSTDADHAKQTALKLLKALEDPFVVDDHNLHVGASLGIVFYPDHGEDAFTLLKRADVAMYVAKNNQSGMAIYNPEHDQHSIKNLVLVTELRQAIERENLILYYQPKIDFRTDSVRGVEALVRWNHPKHGYIEPDNFIPLAEYTGLIKPLTSWVLKTAISQYNNWIRDGVDEKIVVSVNLSSISLLDPLFSEELEGLIKTSGIKPENIELEITESAVMTDPEQAMETVKQLRALGTKLSIDDFGTGYSSLAYLKRLPVNEIKIDKSFVMNMIADENDEMIVRSTIDLAHNLGLDVIAEGVDSGEVWSKLHELKCDGAQGYHICFPLPAKELIRWLKGRDMGAGRNLDSPVHKP
jgi:diguanylate cyclase (GGDEF)-like protein